MVRWTGHGHTIRSCSGVGTGRLGAAAVVSPRDSANDLWSGDGRGRVQPYFESASTSVGFGVGLAGSSAMSVANGTETRLRWSK